MKDSEKMTCKKCKGQMILKDMEIDDNGQQWHVYECQQCGRREWVKTGTKHPPIRGAE